MPSPAVAPRLRRAGVVVGIVAALAVLLLGHSFGRAVPTNNYRPLITADAIESGCYPLPGGARLDGLAYQVRWDEDVETPAGERRRLRGQYDLVDREEAERRIVGAFLAVGFEDRSGSADLATGRRVLRKGAEQVVVTVTEIPGTSARTLVRGEFVLDLPVVAPARDSAECRDPKSTKRWTPADRSDR